MLIGFERLGLPLPQLRGQPGVAGSGGAATVGRNREGAGTRARRGFRDGSRSATACLSSRGGGPIAFPGTAEGRPDSEASAPNQGMLPNACLTAFRILPTGLANVAAISGLLNIFVRLKKI